MGTAQAWMMKVKPVQRKQQRAWNNVAVCKPESIPPVSAFGFRSAGSGLAEASPATYNHFPQISSKNRLAATASRPQETTNCCWRRHDPHEGWCLPSALRVIPIIRTKGNEESMLIVAPDAVTRQRALLFNCWKTWSVHFFQLRNKSISASHIHRWMGT
jgi:hypothetical protein